MPRARTCFASSVTRTDAFIDLPKSAQVLYYQCALDADGDGFIVGMRGVARLCGCTQDDIVTLVKEGYLLEVDGMHLIRHWWMNNRPKNYKAGTHAHLLSLFEGGEIENNAPYTFANEGLTIGERGTNEGLTIGERSPTNKSKEKETEIKGMEINQNQINQNQIKQNQKNEKESPAAFRSPYAIPCPVCKRMHVIIESEYAYQTDPRKKAECEIHGTYYLCKDGTTELE